MGVQAIPREEAGSIDIGGVRPQASPGPSGMIAVEGPVASAVPAMLRKSGSGSGTPVALGEVASDVATSAASRFRNPHGVVGCRVGIVPPPPGGRRLSVDIRLPWVRAMLTSF